MTVMATPGSTRERESFAERACGVAGARRHARFDASTRALHGALTNMTTRA